MALQQWLFLFHVLALDIIQPKHTGEKYYFINGRVDFSLFYYTKTRRHSVLRELANMFWPQERPA